MEIFRFIEKIMQPMIFFDWKKFCESQCKTSGNYSEVDPWNVPNSNQRFKFTFSSVQFCLFILKRSYENTLDIWTFVVIHVEKHVCVFFVENFLCQHENINSSTVYVKNPFRIRNMNFWFESWKLKDYY